jgi:hypothetical protein
VGGHTGQDYEALPVVPFLQQGAGDFANLIDGIVLSLSTGSVGEKVRILQFEPGTAGIPIAAQELQLDFVMEGLRGFNIPSHFHS